MASNQNVIAASTRAVHDAAGRPVDRIVNSVERRALIPLSDQRVWALENEGKFPRRVKVGEGRFGRVGWYLSELLAYMDAKRAARDSSLAAAS